MSLPGGVKSQSCQKYYYGAISIEYCVTLPEIQEKNGLQSLVPRPFWEWENKEFCGLKVKSSLSLKVHWCHADAHFKGKNQHPENDVSNSLSPVLIVLI